MIRPVSFPSFSGKLIIQKEPSDNFLLKNAHGDTIKNDNVHKSAKRLLDRTYNRITEDQMRKVDEISDALKEIVEKKLPENDTVTFNFHSIQEISTRKYSSGSLIKDFLGQGPVSVKIDYKPGYKLKYIPGDTSPCDFKNSEIILPVGKIDKAITWINKIVKMRNK